MKLVTIIFIMEVFIWIDAFIAIGFQIVGAHQLAILLFLKAIFLRLQVTAYSPVLIDKGD